jgi:methylenetetrahydrofolate reductase (NADPH)
MDTKKIASRSYSFEFFPPKTQGSEDKLAETAHRLEQLSPDFFSVTYGAGGSTRERTIKTVGMLRDSTGVVTAPHLSCIGSTEEELTEIINQYKADNFKHIVTLRGDLPSGAVGSGSLRFAHELVELVRKVSGDHFQIEVACYPEFHPSAKSPRHDLENLKRKIDAGADRAITQYFYNPDAYFRFVDSCEKIGIDTDILPGIMPITNSTSLLRFSEICGAEIPAWIAKRLIEFGDDVTGIREFGIDVVSQLCESLLTQGAPGLHIYTMNQADASEALWTNLSITNE